jgi:hypothetical protein
MRKLFTRRPMNAALFETTPVPSSPSKDPSQPIAASPGGPETA